MPEVADSGIKQHAEYLRHVPATKEQQKASTVVRRMRQGN